MVRGTPARGTPSRAVADAAIDTAEVVFLGELTGATGFKETCSGSVLCKYVVVHGEHWHLSRGDVSGATQASWPSACGGELAAWGHPLQLSFNTTSVQGWPKLLFALYERDAWAGVDTFAGYGVCALPLSPGTHTLRAHCFAANDRNHRLRQEMEHFFGGARAELEGWRASLLRREEMHASPAVTTGVGVVHLDVHCLFRHMDVSGLHVGGVTQAAAAERARRAALRNSQGLRDDDENASPIASTPKAWGSPVKDDGRGFGSPRGESGLDSIRRSVADAAVTATAGTLAERRARRAADALGGARSSYGGVGGDLPPRRARGGFGASASSALSERRAALAIQQTGAASSAEPADFPANEDAVSAFSYQREAIEDAPLAVAGGRVARRAARAARMSAGAGAGAGGYDAGGRRSRRGNF